MIPSSRTVLLLFFLIGVLLTAGTAHALQISAPGGFYPGDVAINISVAPGATAYCTLDGSDPRVNGTRCDGELTIARRSDVPSALAQNPETSLQAFTAPNTTLKASILRVVETNATGTAVAEQAHTYFIGHNAADFTTPIFSIVIDPKYLDNYTIGMYIKGATYYNDLAANGGVPDNPFRPANWNNDSLRWPAHYELFSGGALQVSDPVVFYPSGRWSAGLAKKSFKLKYDKALGKSQSTYPFFGNESVPYYVKLRLRQGSQDWSHGIQMRDCVIGEMIQGMNVEAAHCRQAALFINGEYWGVYNIHEDFDNKLLAAKYGIGKDDVVILEQDGIVSDGLSTDNQPYFELRDWLRTHNLSDQANYEYFASKVNTESLIDYSITHQFFNNVDFPNDHRFWRNKNPATQVNGTPYDGRWYFEPKDRDQTMGLYSHINYTDNAIERMLSKPDGDWGTLFFNKAMENPGFRQRFIERNQELLGTRLSKAQMDAVMDRVAQEKRPELPREISRWGRPWNLGWWDKEVIEAKEWLHQRHDLYPTFLAAINASNIATNTTNTTNQTNATNQTNGTPICYAGVSQLPVTCDGGAITQDTFDGTCRTIVCGAKQVAACNKDDGHFAMYNQVRADGIKVCVGDPSYGGLCMTNWGYLRAGNSFPLCTSSTSSVCGNGVIEPPEQCDGSAPAGYVCAACVLNATVNSTNNTNSTKFSLTVQSMPSGELRINSTSYGSTPRTVLLVPGHYAIAVSAPGYLPNATTISLTGNTSVSFILRQNTSGNVTPVCYASVSQLPVKCTGGNITQDAFSGMCRTIVCGGKQVMACDKSDGYFAMYNQVRVDSITVCLGDPSYGGLCMADWGYLRASQAFPLCTAPAVPLCGNRIIEPPEQCDGSAPAGYVCNNCALQQNVTTVTVRLTGAPDVIAQALVYLRSIPGVEVE